MRSPYATSLVSRLVHRQLPSTVCSLIRFPLCHSCFLRSPVSLAEISTSDYRRHFQTSSHLKSDVETTEPEEAAKIIDQIVSDYPDIHSKLNLSKYPLPDIRNTYATRSHTCGELRPEHAGLKVTLVGWLQFRRMALFLVLRDAYGIVQVMLPQESEVSFPTDLPVESVVSVEGTVQLRPPGQENPKMITGGIEVVAEKVSVLSIPSIHPFPVVGKKNDSTREDIRLKDRYLDIRRAHIQETLRFRSKVNHLFRRFLVEERGFVEVETPTLFRKTPGGAKEFVVPSTSLPGRFYSLVQSPQQFKQLLMVGGIDRYFQFARCYRDEGSRPDRQPEFTQLDLELSFPSRDGIISLVEELLAYALPLDAVPPFRRLTYHQAMSEYGCDKPDLRFGSEIISFDHIIRNSNIFALKDRLLATGDNVCRCIVFRNVGNRLPAEFAEKQANGLVSSFLVSSPGRWQGNVAKYVDRHARRDWQKFLDLNDGDLVVVSVGRQKDVQVLLGELRLKIANQLDDAAVKSSERIPLLRDPQKRSFLWVTDFPLFEEKETPTGGMKWESVHHPFTAPVAEDASKMFLDPGCVRAEHWDLVLNGAEIAGGSARIHSSDIQRRVLSEILEENADEMGHLLRALDTGAPPHAGIALGLDRLYTILLGRNSIRDVIAFPKTVVGQDLMSGAPTPLGPEDLKEYQTSLAKGLSGEALKDVPIDPLGLDVAEAKSDVPPVKKQRGHSRKIPLGGNPKSQQFVDPNECE